MRAVSFAHVCGLQGRSTAGEAQPSHLGIDQHRITYELGQAVRTSPQHTLSFCNQNQTLLRSRSGVPRRGRGRLWRRRAVQSGTWSSFLKSERGGDGLWRSSPRRSTRADRGRERLSSAFVALSLLQQAGGRAMMVEEAEGMEWAGAPGGEVEVTIRRFPTAPLWGEHTIPEILLAIKYHFEIFISHNFARLLASKVKKLAVFAIF
eukprot:6179336-Pleurochrysis_carterae.AAC.1